MDLTLLRQHIRNQRKALSLVAIQDASEKVATFCAALPVFQQAKHIAYYITHENEIDANYILRISKQHQKIAYFPAVHNDTIDFIRVDEDTAFTENKFGILEPVSEVRIDANQLDIIFIPVVAFNEKCHRIGRGKGYYDRTLASANHPVLIGLAYEFQKAELPQKEIWDIAMDYVITEARVYYPESWILP
ncbi:MAG: 5-formyltetrahydrofolate cyclo-ligase [Gammaproteobacteria bacterium RIFCSPHIGHO2_12_FULL_42_13]|nr:MAG: 5-formyltetrahydrofolate cyclo-ligase [Gammaproteobacteria bacterium RIFCSPHIGHO2_12_FULL_42_13]